MIDTFYAARSEQLSVSTHRNTDFFYVGVWAL